MTFCMKCYMFFLNVCFLETRKPFLLHSKTFPLTLTMNHSNLVNYTFASKMEILITLPTGSHQNLETLSKQFFLIFMAI